MKTRKVQLSGGTTYTVSLPKSWATEQGIEAGSVLSLQPNGDGTLLVRTASDRETEDRSASVDVSTMDDDAIGRCVRALYTIGCEEMTLRDPTGHGPGRRQVVEGTADDLSGLELLEVGEKVIRLTNLVDAENVDVRKITLRFRLVALAMHRDAVTAVTTADTDLAKRVVERDSEADKLFAMVTRYFRRSLSDLYEIEKLGATRDDLFEYFYTCRQLERVADHAEKIARFVTDRETSVPEEYVDPLQSVGSRARSVVDDAADCILAGGSLETAQAALVETDALAADIESLNRELYGHEAPEQAYVVGLVLDSMRRTAAHGGNVATLAIQQELREQSCVTGRTNAEP